MEELLQVCRPDQPIVSSARLGQMVQDFQTGRERQRLIAGVPRPDLDTRIALLVIDTLDAHYKVSLVALP